MSSSSIQNYTIREKLGRGSFATVWRAVNKENNKEVAIKDIFQEKLTLKLQENLESEISILKNHVHRNIVKLYDIHRTEKHIYIVLEYCKGGDLQRFIKCQQPVGRLPEAVAQHFMRHLASGLKFLNDRNLVHRDIKPQNLLLTENSPTATLKIADFGFARHLEETSMADTLCGSPLYMAPEILSHNQYNAKADLWSVGTVLFEMVAGKPPFSASNQVELMHVIKKEALQLPPDVTLSPACMRLLKGLLKRNPLERISFEDFFQDEFVSMGQEVMVPVTVSPTSSTLEEPAFAYEGGHTGTATSSSLLIRGKSHATSSDLDSPRHHHHHHPVVPPDPSCSSGGAPMAVSNNSSTSSATSSRIPYQPSPAFVPSPRVNPFKPLAASPPGAAALAMASYGARSSSSFSSSSRRPHGAGQGSAGTGGQMGNSSTESDGFVIVDAEEPEIPSHPNLQKESSTNASTATNSPAMTTRPVTISTSSSNSREILAVAPSSSCSSKPSPGGPDSMEHALRVLAYVEASCRRAVLIASLGDAKVITALSCRREMFPSGVLDYYPQLSVLSTMLGDLHHDQHLVTKGPQSPEGMGSIQVPTLMMEALILYVKGLSVVRTAIKALRQTMEVLRLQPALTGSSSQQRSSLLSSGSSSLGVGGGSHPRLGSASMDQDRPKDALSSSSSLVARVGSLKDWLEQHFTAILERAEECKLSLRATREAGYSSNTSAATTTGTTTMGSMESSTAFLQQGPSAEELLYRHALSLAKEAAVKELLGHFDRGQDLFSQAKLIMEALLAEPAITLDDQRVLESYVAEFGRRLDQMGHQCEVQQQQQQFQYQR